MFLKIVLNIFDNTEMTVATRTANYGNIKVNTGVLQGDSLSALLFNIFFSDITLEFQEQGPLLQTIRISCISYVDDTVMLAESAENLKRILEKLELYCEVNQLSINAEKTKVLIFRAGGPVPKEANFQIKEAV